MNEEWMKRGLYRFFQISSFLSLPQLALSRLSLLLFLYFRSPFILLFLVPASLSGTIFLFSFRQCLRLLSGIRLKTSHPPCEPLLYSSASLPSSSTSSYSRPVFVVLCDSRHPKCVKSAQVTQDIYEPQLGPPTAKREGRAL